MPGTLDILLYGRKIGQIIDLGGDRNLFVFADAYLGDPARPVLSLGFKGAQGGVAYQPRPRQTQVDPFFSNLLPEGRLRAYVADSNRVHAGREFQLLRRLGGDLPGAVEVRSAAGDDSDAELSCTLAQPANSGPLKFSLAGVQMKLSALKTAEGGLTVPASGLGGRWIVKFPSETMEAVPQNEFWMMTLAQRMGLNVPDIELVEMAAIGGLPPGVRTDRGAALAVRRFDREADGTRVHMEDFAQVFRIYPRNKYAKINFDQIGEVIWREAGDAAFAQFIARLVFIAAIGNGDMHAKNWSLLHPPSGPPILAPAYDLVSTLTYVADENLGLNLAGSKAFEDVSLDRFEDLARRASAPVALARQAAIAAAERFHEEWPSLRAEAELPERLVTAIDAHIGRVPLLRARRFFGQGQIEGVKAIVDRTRPAQARVAQLADLFEEAVLSERLREDGVVTATFAFALEDVPPLKTPPEGRPWSGPELRRSHEETRRDLRALALEASDPAVIEMVLANPPFRPRRGRNVSAARIPIGLMPMIGDVGAEASSPWWLLAAGAGVVQRRLVPDASGGGLTIQQFAADLGGLFAFLGRFAEAFPEAVDVTLDVRWRGLTGVRMKTVPGVASDDERRFTGSMSVMDLSRRTRAAGATSALNSVLRAWRLSTTPDNFERLARGA